MCQIFNKLKLSLCLYHNKIILAECGLSYMWQNQCNMLINFETINSRILDIYQQSWYSAINNSRRLETYSLLKHDFMFEPYLDLDLP